MLEEQIKAIKQAGFEVTPLGEGRDHIPKWRVNRPNATVEAFAYFEEQGMKELAADCAADNQKALAQKVPKVSEAKERKKSGKTQDIVTSTGSFRTALTFNPNRIRRMINRELREHIAACDAEAERFEKAGALKDTIKQFLLKYKKPAEVELKDRESGKVVRYGRAALPDSTPDAELPPFSPKPGQDTGLRKILAEQRHERKSSAASKTTRKNSTRKQSIKQPAKKKGTRK
jgi:hypothetical protein